MRGFMELNPAFRLTPGPSRGKRSRRRNSPSMARFALPSLFVAAAIFPFLLAEEPKSEAGKQLDRLRTQIKAAHTAGDSSAYIARSREMQAFLHGSPNSILQLMSAQAFSGDQEAALKSFESFIALGQSNPQVFAGKSFDNLRKSPQFAVLESKMRKNEAAISHSTEVFRMPEAGLIPEDIDYDPASARFYVTSVMKNEILSLDMKGQSQVFAQAPDHWPMMALKIDSPRHLLWATEVALDGFASIPSGQWKTSAVLVYELATGKLLHRIPGPPKAILGDMALTGNGDAIASDNDGAVYRINAKSFEFERLDSGEFISPQTPVPSPDGRRLFVPDYVRGVAILELATRRVTWLSSHGAHALDGIDGLYLVGRTLIATQNGTSPERVIRFELDSSLTRVVSESIVERATPTLGDPTHGVIVNGTFYYIANSGWDTLEDNGTAKAGTTPSPGVLMRFTLP